MWKVQLQVEKYEKMVKNADIIDGLYTGLFTLYDIEYCDENT